MSGVDKVAAVELLRRHGLEVLSTAVFTGRAEGLAKEIGATVGADRPLVVRTAARSEIRNLPRTIALDRDDAAAWIATLPSELTVLVQPYDEVLFSVELASYDDATLAELVVGVWELDNRFTPVTIEIAADGASSIRGCDREQVAVHHDLRRGRHERLSRVCDWQVAAVMTWIRRHAATLSAIRTELGHPVGIKLHYAARHGLAAQNVRTNLPDRGCLQGRQDIGPDLPVITHIEDAIPVGSPVVLDVAIARESFRDLVRLVDRLKRCRVTHVRLKSGVLSHLAITLREEGFEVSSCHA